MPKPDGPGLPVPQRERGSQTLSSKAGASAVSCPCSCTGYVLTKSSGHSRDTQNRLCSGCNQQQPLPQHAEAPVRAPSMVTWRVSLGFESSVAQPLTRGGAES